MQRRLPRRRSMPGVAAWLAFSSQRSLAAKRQSSFLQTYKPLLTNHDMIEHFNVEHLPGLDDIARHGDVFGEGVGSPEG